MMMMMTVIVIILYLDICSVKTYIHVVTEPNLPSFPYILHIHPCKDTLKQS